TLFAELVARGAPLRVDDVREGRVPEVIRRVFAERGYRAVALVPLLSARGVFGAVTLASARAGAFDDEDVEIGGELGRPLASALGAPRRGRARGDPLDALRAAQGRGRGDRRDLGVRDASGRVHGAPPAGARGVRRAGRDRDPQRPALRGERPSGP